MPERPIHRTTFHVSDMDCGSEERLIRMCLDGIETIEHLRFDLEARRLDVFHRGESAPILRALEASKLGAAQSGHERDVALPDDADDANDRGPLIAALAINAGLFVGEALAGWLAGSMGLVADSLDMLADSLVYGLSLAAVGGVAATKRRLARASGYLQFGLAALGLFEVTRRFVTPAEAPEPLTMVVVSLVALAGNVATLLLLRRTQRGDAHIEASWIFTSNDIKVNGLVILAGLTVWWTASRVPDLLAGALIFAIVANGARRIFALSRREATTWGGEE